MLDEVKSEADLLALEESYVEPSAVEKETPWPEHTLVVVGSIVCLRCGNARGMYEQRQTLDELGFEWGDRHQRFVLERIPRVLI